MLEVEKVRPVKVDWRIMSLAYLNLVQHEGKGLNEEYLERMTRAWGPVRVCAAAAVDAGPGILGPLYTAIGTGSTTRAGATTRRSSRGAAEAGLPAWLADAAETAEFDDAIKSPSRGVRRGRPGRRDPGGQIRGKALFGPVITPAPKGEAAGELWDGLVLVSKADGFFELKRSRDRRPTFD